VLNDARNKTLFWLCNPNNIEFQWRRGNGGNGFCCGILPADLDDPRFAILTLHCDARLSPSANIVVPTLLNDIATQFTRSLSPVAIFRSVRSISGFVQQDISDRIEFSADASHSTASIFILYVFRNCIR